MITTSAGFPPSSSVTPQCQILIASWSPGKIKELKEMGRLLNVGFKTAIETGLPRLNQHGTSLEGDAEMKAISCMKATGHAVWAESSMLTVPALGGQPGFEALDWAGPTRDWSRASKVLNEVLTVKGISDRKALYESAMCFALPDGRFVTVRDNLAGKLVWPPRGHGSFDLGFYGMFVPEGETQTLLEMDWSTMANMNHRYSAFQELVKKMFEETLVDIKMIYDPMDAQNRKGLEQTECSPFQDIFELVRPPGTVIINNEYIKPYIQPGKQHLCYPFPPSPEDLEEMHDPDLIRDDCMAMISKACELRRRWSQCFRPKGKADKQRTDDCEWEDPDEYEQEAIGMLSNAYVLAQRLGDSALQALCLVNLGSMYGVSLKAVDIWAKGLELAAADSDTELAVVLLSKTAAVQARLGNARSALDTFCRALQMAKDGGLEDYHGRICCSIAQIHMQLSDFDKASPRTART
jgi:XTP/dITP diphosphohydrolase